MRRLLISSALACLFPAAALAQAPIGYAQATGYFKKDSRPTLYQPLHLLDGREATAWCTPTSDPLDERLTFGFKGSVKLDEVRIYTGNGFDESTFGEFSRARKLVIKGPTGAQTLNLADQRGQQAVALNPPLQGQQFTVEVLDTYPAPDLEAPVCITDIVFYSDGKPLNGPWLTQKLKYDRSQAPLLGTWFAGSEGAPDRFLSFYFDGTYRFVYQPWDPAQKGMSVGGDYDGSGNRLNLEVGKGKTAVKIRRPEPAKGVRTLVLDGEVPGELKQTFRDQM
jgi:hypothetical protein